MTFYIHSEIYILVIYTVSFYYYFTKSKTFNVIGWSCINTSYENSMICMKLGVKRKRTLEVLLMKKMLKIMAMLLVIATVIFAAGCTDNETEGATEEVTDETPVADDEAQKRIAQKPTYLLTAMMLTQVLTTKLLTAMMLTHPLTAMILKTHPLTAMILKTKPLTAMNTEDEESKV